MTEKIYDFDNYQYTDIEETDFIEIEKIEPDPHIRRLKYPYVTHQKKTIMTYIIDNKKIIRTFKTNKLKGKKKILERLNWKRFGDAIENNLGITSLAINEEFIGENKKSNNYIDIIHDNNKKNFNNKKKNGFVISKLIDNIDIEAEINNKESEMNNNSNIRGYKTSKYIPNILKNNKEKNSENFSIVIKNFPNEISNYYLEQKLRNIFEVYGPINKIKTLYDKNTNKLKDIAFIDFYKTEDAIKVINSSKKFIIESCVLSLEKSKKIT